MTYCILDPCLGEDDMLQVELDESGDMRVNIPGTKGLGHDVYIPISLEGVRVLKRLLQERKGREDARIGEPGAPTAHQIKMWVSEEKKVVARPKAEPKVNKKLAGVKLDLSSLAIKL